MGLSKCLCGRLTDFGTLCVFCSRDKLLDKADDQEVTQSYTSENEQEEDCLDFEESKS
jgi:hypothetical protein